jgi:signal transduction histidine kinase
MLPTLRQWSTTSRRLAAVFLIVLVPSAATLVWLGVQLLEQDQRLWADRDLERRETAADVIVRSMGQKLAAVDADLDAGRVPDGAVIARFGETLATVSPTSRVAWLPTMPGLPEANASVFADAEIAEFRRTGDRGRSIYTSFLDASSPTVRAGALLRLARVHRTSGEITAAIQNYRALARFNAAFDGTPADLVARRAICELLAQTGDSVSLAREAEAVRSDFLQGRWTLDRPRWVLVADEIERWTARPLDVTREQRALAAALDWLWQQRYARSDDQRLPEAGRRSFRANDVSILAQWRPIGSDIRVLLIPPPLVHRWARDVMPRELASADELVLADDSGAIVMGTRSEGMARLVTRLATETGLPWNVSVKAAVVPADMAELSSRRRLLWAGLGAIAILLSGGSYLLWRTVKRELAVARIQTEFVAAVSHEFRTPLTSLQHATQLLEEDDELPPARRQSLYAALGRSSERLRGLVESLLDFARMEEGRRPYDLRSLDPSSLVQSVVEEFERQAHTERTVITRDLAPPGMLQCRADATAMRHALWNLLDNAVKYSPEPHVMRISVGSHRAGVSIAIADQGFGIPVREQKSVFRRFVRGSQTQQRGITGTGLGLAMVSHIVAAHRGRIELESEEGRGSTFTILLPSAKSDARDGGEAGCPESLES